jgi:hypothetical protein
MEPSRLERYRAAADATARAQRAIQETIDRKKKPDGP